MAGVKIKKPRSSLAPGTGHKIRGTTLLISRGRSLRTPISPIPVTGETGSHYWGVRPFTGSTQEPDLRIRRTGSHRPPALWSMGKGRIFPSMSLTCIHMTFKHKQHRLSTVFRGKMYTEIQGGISFHFVKQWGLTFVRSRAKVWTSKRISQTAVTKTVRQSVLSESQRLVQADSPVPVDPSLPSRCAECVSIRRTRLPALRDRTCWSLKGAAWSRNLSGTAGMLLLVSREMRTVRFVWGVFYFVYRKE